MAIAIGFAGLSAAGCTEPREASAPQSVETAQPTETGTLEFRANGEDFVRQGFVSKDGWQIDFDHLYVTLSEVKAYQADSPDDPEAKEADVSQVVEVPEQTTVDLAAGGEQADPVLVAAVEAPVGQYNALSWEMVPAASGPAAGSTLKLVGNATKGNETIPFTVQLDPEYAYSCGEYVGDGRKGLLSANDLADVEATFHFDHIFGDGEAAADDPINTGAVGFEPMAALASDGALMADMTALKQGLSPQDYSRLEEALVGLGHVGEGHCSEVSAAHDHEHDG